MDSDSDSVNGCNRRVVTPPVRHRPAPTFWRCWRKHVPLRVRRPPDRRATGSARHLVLRVLAGEPREAVLRLRFSSAQAYAANSVRVRTAWRQSGGVEAATEWHETGRREGGVRRVPGTVARSTRPSPTLGAAPASACNWMVAPTC